MADLEKYGFRNAAYSAWHRPKSIGRYIDEETAEAMRQIDLDAILGDDMELRNEVTTWIEFARSSSWPLALIETAVDVGQSDKPTRVTQSLARMSDLPGAVALYKLSELLNPADRRANDIESFRVRRLWLDPESEFRLLSPSQYAKWLVKARGLGAKRWQQFISQESLRAQAKEVWEALKEERQRSRVLEQENEKLRQQINSMKIDRRKSELSPAQVIKAPSYGVDWNGKELPFPPPQ